MYGFTPIPEYLQPLTRELTMLPHCQAEQIILLATQDMLTIAQCQAERYLGHVKDTCTDLSNPDFTLAHEWKCHNLQYLLYFHAIDLPCLLSAIVRERTPVDPSSGSILTGSGLDPDRSEDQVSEIHEENLSLLAAMSEEQIQVERSQLLEMLGQWFPLSCVWLNDWFAISRQ